MQAYENVCQRDVGIFLTGKERAVRQNPNKQGTGDKKMSQWEQDKQALARIFTSDRQYCADLMNEVFVRDTEQARSMTNRLVESMTYSKQVNERCMQAANEQALVRVFTSDRVYCSDMFNRLFRRDTEEGRLMTTRLLQAIYEDRGEDPYTEELPRVKRVQHYTKQAEWLSETCRLYVEAAQQVAGVEGRAAALERWKQWEQVMPV